MIEKTQVQKFQNCKKYTPSSVKVQALRNDIYTYIPLTQFLIKKYDITDVEDLKFCVSNFVNSIFTTCTHNSYIDSSLYELQAIESILKEPMFISQEYSNAKNMPNTHTVYTANLSRSKKLALVNAIDEVLTIENFAEQKGITATTNPREVSINVTGQTTEKEAKRFISLVVDIIKQKSMHSKIKLMLEREKEECQKFIKENQIQTLTSFFDFMNSFDLLDRYLSSYLVNSKKFGFRDLKYELSTNECTKDSIGLKELFSEDFLQTLPLKDLCYLTAFWCNRFAKETSSMSAVFSTIDSLDLWQDIIDGHTNFLLSDKELITALQKHKYLSNILGESFSMYQKSVTSREIKEGNNFNGSLSKDYTNYYSKLHNSINKDYFNYFSRHLDGTHNFLDDIVFAVPFVNLEMYSYFKKDTTLNPLIKGLLDNPNLKNWGIIRKELTGREFIDSINENKSKILVAFDIEGFNMPFRLHLLKSDLMDLCQASNGNFLMPEYQGFTDFIVDNEVIPSNIIMPIPKRHRAVISEHAKSNDANKNLWEHFQFLMKGKFPPHLTQTICNNKKQPVTSRSPIIYTDLKTGKRYVKNNNNFLEVSCDENIR